MSEREQLEAMAAKLAAHPDYRVLRRLDTTLQRPALSGTTIRTVHIVGGGSRNELLCQLTADRVGLPVLAGPVEATAIGNVLIQARAQGLVRGTLEDLRALVARSFPPSLYLPTARRPTKD